jgi:hypothetical protein
VDSLAEKIYNVIPYVRWYFFGAERPGGCHRFFVSIQEIDTVGADPKVSLEILRDGSTEGISQVPEYEIGYLFAGSVG